MRLTDGRGADLVVDPVGGRALEGSIAALAYRGRISWMGNAGGAAQPPEHLAADGEERHDHDDVLRHGAVEAAASGPTTSSPARSSASARGELRAVVDRTFPLADAAEAHRYVEQGVGFGRTVMIP